MYTILRLNRSKKELNGLITHSFTYFEQGAYTFPVVFSNTNYRVIGGATVIDGIARRQCYKYVGYVDFNSDVHKWTTEDILVIGY